MLTDAGPFALFDDNLAEDGDLLLTGLHQIISCTHADQVGAAFSEIERARAQGLWVAVCATYELGLVFEPRLRRHVKGEGQPLLTAWVFEHATRRSAKETQQEIARALACLDEHQRLGGVADVVRGASQASYCATVARIRALIAAGECYQVNFTFPLRGQLFGHPLAVYDALRRRQPVRYGALIQHPDGAILSRSPELFVKRNGDRLVCRPMKGTAPRAEAPAVLTESEKNRAENVMIVDLIRNDLGRIAPAGGVRVERLFDVEAYPSVWQMTSTVSAHPVHADLLTIFRALFPCGSITGAPKIRAMEVIAEVESHARGVYCGALGWLAPSGDFRFSVPIRTLESASDGRFRCGLGSGIVADSDPEGEWEECLLKGRFVTGLGPSFGLIETLRCEAQCPRPYPLLERHLARLTASAGFFGIPLNVARLRCELDAIAAQLVGVHRVRVELDPAGTLAFVHAPLQPLGGALPSVAVSSCRVASDDLLLRHKTTARAFYDAELGKAVAAGHFDVLFFNERDELTEGARTNVFVDHGDGVLHTPPLGSGVLDGVYRRKLLDEGTAREAVVSREALYSASHVYVANALRGLHKIQPLALRLGANR